MTHSYVVERAHIPARRVDDPIDHEHKWHSFTLTGSEEWDRCETCGNYRTPKPEWLWFAHDSEMPDELCPDHCLDHGKKETA